jgi:hypothetical protein
VCSKPVIKARMLTLVMPVAEARVAQSAPTRAMHRGSPKLGPRSFARDCAGRVRDLLRGAPSITLLAMVRTCVSGWTWSSGSQDDSPRPCDGGGRWQGGQERAKDQLGRRYTQASYIMFVSSDEWLLRRCRLLHRVTFADLRRGL